MPLKNLEARRKYNLSYKAAHKEEGAARDRRNIRRHKAWMSSIRTRQGCEECGKRIGKLVHHHLDPKTKRNDVSCMSNCSIETILDEIAKCTVLCDSCQARWHGRADHLNHKE